METKTRTRKTKSKYQYTIYDNPFVKDIYNVVPVLTDGKFPMKNNKIDESFDDFVIPLMRSKCGYIYTTHEKFGDNEIMVAFITSRTVVNDINKNCNIKFLRVIDNEGGTGKIGKKEREELKIVDYEEKSKAKNEIEYYFLDKDLKELDKFVKIGTGGAKTSPFKKGSM